MKFLILASLAFSLLGIKPAFSKIGLIAGGSGIVALASAVDVPEIGIPGAMTAIAGLTLLLGGSHVSIWLSESHEYINSEELYFVNNSDFERNIHEFRQFNREITKQDLLDIAHKSNLCQIELVELEKILAESI
jgi:hypothetical protein